MRRAHKRALHQRGFSVLELSIVLGCISVLCAIAIPQFQRSLNRSHAVEAVTTANTIERELVEYYNRNNEYPPYANGEVPVEPSPPLSAGKQEWDKGQLVGWTDINFTGSGSYYYRYTFSSLLNATTGLYDQCTITAQAQLLGDATTDEFYIYLEQGYRTGDIETGE